MAMTERTGHLAWWALVPTILFFNAEGQEQPERRVTGFIDAAAFSAHLRDWQA